MPVVLVVDDDATVRSSLRRILRGMGLDVVDATDGVDAVGKLAGTSFDLIITDLRMPRADGFEVLTRARERQPGAPVVVLTAHGSLTDCVAAMRAGAADFVTKPFHLSEFEEVVRKALQRRQAPTEKDAVPAKGQSPRRGAGGSGHHAPMEPVAILGESPALAEVLATVERAAPTEATVLITGETGTGKEVIARLLHGLSGRAGQPFITVNCGAIPENLIESELFGHAKGAFTGAVERRIGRFVQADGGTLFLDEIGELPLPAQVKLLRFLQESEVSPIGESASLRVDARVLAATHRNLEELVAQGKFREDLMYRLTVVPLEMPPLRSRGADVILLAKHFLVQSGQRLGRELRFADATLEVLLGYAWPGNVRELGNLVERLAILARDPEILPEHLPPKIRGAVASRPVDAPRLPEQGIHLDQALSNIEDDLIDAALKRAGGNKSQAARLLGINRTTLVEKLKRRGREA